MGTRADFYIGRGKQAQWIGSIAWDGYPDGNPKPLLTITEEKAFRDAVAGLLDADAGGPTKPEHGWPWPWEDSNTTDYAYAFDSGRVWGTCFGHGWWPADAEPEDHSAKPKDIEWPRMKTDNNPPIGSIRSGVMVITSR